ncbi:MAG: hypothetical protein FWF78_02920 [Defluviitaleaceae bacterium]|nr:hypothetical protein [Defluviitaleaceae bacterium]
MEWERAKNYILIAFVILNLGLATLLYMEDRRYTLTQERISNIHAILSANKINLYTAPLRRFAPMRHLDISGFYYDIPALLEIFFPYTEVMQVDIADGHYRFETENNNFGQLSISNGFISFDNTENLRENREAEISREEAISVSQEFISLHFPDFVMDSVFDAFGGYGWHITYRQEYRGRIITSNEIIFIFSDGLDWIDMSFGRVIGHSAEPRMIFAPDEILLTFMQRMSHVAMENPIFISDIDIVYFQEYQSNYEGSVYPAIPFYRIFVQDHDMPFLINAYTNVPHF